MPSSFSTIPRITANSTGGVSSRHFWNSRTYSSGKMVGEDAMNCPSLMYVAPSRSKSILRITSGRSVALVDDSLAIWLCATDTNAWAA